MMLSVSLGATKRLLMVFPLQMHLNTHFAEDIPEAYTKALGVGSHHVDVVHLAVLVHMCSSVYIAVLETEMTVNFGLQSMETQLR